MEKENKYYVYAYLDPMKPGKYQYPGLNFSFLYEPFYIGKGIGQRFKSHLHGSAKETNLYKKRKIDKIYKESGIEPYIIFLENNISDEYALSKEINYIKSIGRSDLELGSLTNLTNGGEGVSGRIVSEELKKRFSEERKGVNNPMYGKKFSSSSIELLIGRIPWNKGLEGVYSEETKKKMGEKNKNKKQSQETISKRNKKNIGKKRTKEFSDKLSQERMGENNPMYGKYKNILLQYDLNGIFIKEWNGISTAIRELGIKTSGISKIMEVCSEKRKTAYGYKWAYK